ncbi:unnamed protein product, partial [Mesorhabditis belari]|uniref:Transmembrane protein n=1 Tax=Mesorhabditis belari TaxID=2138241 RepID=A0AAF3F2Q6_9BILA
MFGSGCGSNDCMNEDMACVVVVLGIGCLGAACCCVKGCNELGENPDSRRGWWCVLLGFLVMLGTLCAAVFVLLYLTHHKTESPSSWASTEPSNSTNFPSNSTQFLS